MNLPSLILQCGWKCMTNKTSHILLLNREIYECEQPPNKEDNSGVAF